jgi:hypothetical protein
VTAACAVCGAALPAQVLEVREVGIVLAPAHDEAEGLLAWASVVARGIAIEGITVRRRRDGEIVVTYPARKAGRGGLYRIVTPTDPALDRSIRAAVIAEYIEARRKAGREGRR